MMVAKECTFYRSDPYIMLCGGMALLYLVAAFVCFMWWVRGGFIPAAFLAFCSGGLVFGMFALELFLGSKFDDAVKVLTTQNGPLFIFIAIAAFAPWYIRQQIERRRAEAQDRAINGVRFSGD
ncbi:hypothetical protein NKW54_08375 [Acetobacter cerevisiae]|nr:hypothetical protein [Acetobacter cerevisiae]MCP1245953.1 hypothetical protein [Acetobacter cerevisiae]